LKRCGQNWQANEIQNGKSASKMEVGWAVIRRSHYRRCLTVLEKAQKWAEDLKMKQNS
jgi:hypothetical protein